MSSSNTISRLRLNCILPPMRVMNEECAIISRSKTFPMRRYADDFLGARCEQVVGSV